MKKYLLIILLLTLTFCKEETTEPEKEKPGSVTISLDKTNIPDNVVLVKAALTREGFDDLIKELNLLSETVAEIQVEEMVAGKWHLKVEAFDGDDVAIYAGETDIDVKPGEVLPLSLKLTPVVENLGGIYIYTNWDQLPYYWFDQPTNPILQKDGSQYDILGVGEPIVLYENDSYKMWYSGFVEGGTTFIMYATSDDGLTWNKYSNHPVINPGQGTWDGSHVQPGPVIKISGTYHMYYSGFNDQNSKWGIGLATSLDGINWEKKSDPILIDDSGWDYQKVASSILYVNSKYYLFYAGKNPSTNHWRIATAISIDGINFEKSSLTFSLEPTLTWEGEYTGYPSVIYEDNQFKMIYHSVGGFGIAYSFDGINWTKFLEESFFPISQSIASPNQIAYPCLIKTENEYRIYYTGFRQDGEWMVCVARKFMN